MLSFIFEYGASLFDAILVVWFITKFTKKSFDTKKNPYWIPAILIIFAYSIFSDNFMPNYNVLSTLLYFALYVAYALLIAPDRKIRALISAGAFEVSVVLFSTLMFFLASLTINDFEVYFQGSDSYIRYIYLILHKVTLFVVCRLLLFVFKADDQLDAKNGFLTIAFTLITIIGVAAAMVISVNTNDRIVQNAAFIITFAFILSNVFLYFLISQILKLQKTKQELKMLENKIDFEQQRYRDAKEIWDDVRKSRHDMKQHLTVVDGYLAEREFDKCKHYVEKLLPTVEKRENAVIRSDNKVIDYIINSKLGKRKNIDLLITGTIGDISDISEPDMVSILGNMLDNAIEATEKTAQKHLEIIFYMQGANRCIICKNSINESVLKNNKALKTTKRNSDLHGYGTAIIRQTVKKYNGFVDFYEEVSPSGSLMFCVQVLIPKAVS